MSRAYTLLSSGGRRSKGPSHLYVLALGAEQYVQFPPGYRVPGELSGLVTRAHPQQNCHSSGGGTGVFLRSPEQTERRYVPGYCLAVEKEMQCEGQNTDS